VIYFIIIIIFSLALNCFNEVVHKFNYILSPFYLLLLCSFIYMYRICIDVYTKNFKFSVLIAKIRAMFIKISS